MECTVALNVMNLLRIFLVGFGFGLKAFYLGFIGVYDNECSCKYGLNRITSTRIKVKTVKGLIRQFMQISS